MVIHVNDVNDNPPVFDRPTYETQITEEDDRNLPKRVLKVQNVSVWFSLFGVLKFCFVDCRKFSVNFIFLFYLHVLFLFSTSSLSLVLME